MCVLSAVLVALWCVVYACVCLLPDFDSCLCLQPLMCVCGHACLVYNSSFSCVS